MSCPSIHWGEPAAQSIHQQQFAAHLTKGGHEVTLLARPPLGGQPSPPTEAQLVLLGASAPPLERVTFSLQTRTVVRRLLSEGRFDLVHDRGYLGGGVALRAASRAGLPSVLQIDDDWPRTEAQAQPLLRAPRIEAVAHRWCGRLASGATRAFAVSQSLRQTVVTDWGADATHIDVVPNGVDLELFLPDHPQAQRERRTLGLEGREVIVFVGALGPWHGVATLLAALTQVRRQLPQAHALIIGGRRGGTQGEALVQAIAAAGLERAVTALGVVPPERVPGLLSVGDVAVAPYPNVPYGFSPFKVFEYLAAGLPIVASDLPFVREVLDEQVAVLTAAGQPAPLAQALVELLRDDARRRRMGAAARERAVLRHGWGASTRALLSVYERALSSRT